MTDENGEAPHEPGPGPESEVENRENFKVVGQTLQPDPSINTLGAISLAIVLLVIVTFILFFLFPEAVWDHFLYRHFWGPVEIDAGEGPSVPGEEPESGYNPISTLGYGLLLAGGVYLVYSVFDRFSIDIDTRFMLALVPYILLGSVGRVLEDAELFGSPYVYLAISPIIYIVLGLFATAVCVYAFSIPEILGKRALEEQRVEQSVEQRVKQRVEQRVKQKVEQKSDSGDPKGSGIHIERQIPGVRWQRPWVVWQLSEVIPYLLFVTIYTMLHAHAGDDFAFLFHPSVILAVAVFFCVAHLQWVRRGLDGTMRFFLYGSFFLGSFLLFYLRWLSGESWERRGYDGELHIWLIPAIILLALLATALTYGFFDYVAPRIASGKMAPFTGVFTTPVAVMLFAAHYLDAAATYVGIDFYNYSEKHVLPDLLIRLTGTAAVMFVLKFAVLAVIIYVMEYYYREEIQSNPRLAGLMRIAVLVLGLAPGTRDMLRNAAGI